MKLLPEESLLLDPLRAVVCEGHRHGEPRESAAIDWARFLALARYHRVSSLVLLHLDRRGIGLVPQEVVAGLRDRRLAALSGGGKTEASRTNQSNRSRATPNSL